MTTSVLRASNVLASSVRNYFELQRAFEECGPEIQAVIREMLDIWSDPEATEDERDRAINTVVEAMFPALADDFIQSESRLRLEEEAIATNARLRAQEQEFSHRLERVMQAKKWTQEMLAEKAGVSQPAISNMLNRQCRPQRRTIQKFAAVLGVSPDELWPGFSVELPS
jgi:lambda repressor-like predicted transcriptional regulator